MPQAINLSKAPKHMSTNGALATAYTRMTHQGKRNPVQHTSPVHNTLYVLCCMCSTGMLYEGGGKGWRIAPAPLLKWEGGGEEY